MSRVRWHSRIPGPPAPRRSVPGAREENRQSWFSLPEALADAPAMIAVTRGPAHILTYANMAYRRMFGTPRVGGPASQVLPEFVEHGFLAILDEVYRTGRPSTLRNRRVEISARGSAGRRTAWFTVVCAPIRRDTTGPGGVRGILIFAVDVTDQVATLGRLRESERRHRDAALALQRSLLPQRLDTPDELRLSAGYRPGGDDATVGGEWYDVITLGAGRTALVIGDVIGRGVRAAAVMGQLRTAVRAYARQDLVPAEVLHLLDGLAQEIDPTQIATCVYAVFDPIDGELTYSSAGHLPPLARMPDGTVVPLDAGDGPPLGTGDWIHRSGQISLPPGSYVVFYTEGLVDPPGPADPSRQAISDVDALASAPAASAHSGAGPDTAHPEFDGAVPLTADASAHDRPATGAETGIAALAAVLRDAHGDALAVRDRILTRMARSDHDDIALLVLEVPRWCPEEEHLFRTASLPLYGGSEVASRARAFTTGVLASWHIPEELTDSSVLAVSELVTNALTHGRPPAVLRLRRTNRRLIVEVCDTHEHQPQRRLARDDDENGRGISIVAAMASAWGARQTPDGKAVWCEFVLPAAVRATPRAAVPAPARPPA